MYEMEQFIAYFSKWDGFPKEEEFFDITPLTFLINSTLIFTQKLSIKYNNNKIENEKVIEKLKENIDSLNKRLDKPCLKCKELEKSKSINETIINDADDFIFNEEKENGTTVLFSSPNKENELNLNFWNEEDSPVFSPDRAFQEITPKKQPPDRLNDLSPVFIKSNIPQKMKGLKSLSLKSKALIKEIRKSEKEIKQNEQADVKWKIKSATMIEPNVFCKGKAFKQTTLSMEPIKKPRNLLESLPKINTEELPDFLDDTDEDIFEASPNKVVTKTQPKKKRKISENNQSNVVDINETLFIIPEDNKGNSKRNIQEQKVLPLSPLNKVHEFKYKLGRVTKQVERKKLDGWDCDECADYYKYVCRGNKERAKNLMNKCSRHREKYEYRYNTPPGFWDPTIPSTCELKKMDKTQDFDPHRRRSP